jgi:tRNA A37 N6-isopentenylltransferase MiaA
VVAVTNDSMAAVLVQPPTAPAAFDFRGVCLTADRKLLFRSIDKRAEEIVELGLVEETVRVLLAPGAKPNNSITNALGYRQVCAGWWFGFFWSFFWSFFF